MGLLNTSLHAFGPEISLVEIYPAGTFTQMGINNMVTNIHCSIVYIKIEYYVAQWVI